MDGNEFLRIFVVITFLLSVNRPSTYFLLEVFCQVTFVKLGRNKVIRSICSRPDTKERSKGLKKPNMILEILIDASSFFVFQFCDQHIENSCQKLQLL